MKALKEQNPTSNPCLLRQAQRPFLSITCFSAKHANSRHHLEEQQVSPPNEIAQTREGIEAPGTCGNIIRSLWLCLQRLVIVPQTAVLGMSKVCATVA